MTSHSKNGIRRVHAIGTGRRPGMFCRTRSGRSSHRGTQAPSLGIPCRVARTTGPVAPWCNVPTFTLTQPK
jgi:hypothetical protein